MRVFLVIVLLLFFSCNEHETPEPNKVNEMKSKTIKLPNPQLSSGISLEETLQQRRSIREFSDVSLSLEEIGQLAWSAQGITDEGRGLRTAPSAGATFPIELYLLLSGVEEVSDGVYRYDCQEHRLDKVSDGDKRSDVFRAALFQEAVVDAPVVMVITGILERIEPRYGERSLRYMYMEAGHIAQNVSLQGVVLDIGSVVIGAFDDDGIKGVLDLAEGEYPLYIVPIGRMD